MIAQILFANINFAVNIVGFLTFFATGWLSIDSWSLDKNKKSFFYRGIGMFLLSLAFLFSAATLMSGVLSITSQVVKLLGLLIILVSLYSEPLLSPPSKERVGISLVLLSQASVPISAVLLLLVALVYLGKTTKGYEKQLKPAFVAFLLLSLSEFVKIALFASSTNVVYTSELLKQYGPVDNLSLVLKACGIITLLFWTWGYIRFRARVQLFLLFVTSTLIIFTATTFTFTFLLFRNLESTALAHLKTDVKVLQFAVEEIKLRSLSNAKTVSQNSAIVDSLENNQAALLYDKSLEFMKSQESSFLDITDKAGKVIVRAEDNERVGESLAGNVDVASALLGTPLAGVSTEQGIFAPTVKISAASPIVDSGGSVIGSVVTGFDIDSAFVDGIKAVTELNVAVFGGDIRAATTFVTPDGKSRYIGTKESDKKVLDTVINKGELFVGAVNVLNQPFYGAYAPLKSEDGNTIGMLFVGNLQTELLATATKSIELTFIGSIVMMLISIIPTYFISRYINRHLSA